MALRSRDVAITSILAFIAWRLATSWVPTLRFLGYAFVAGFIFALASLTALIISSSRKKKDTEILYQKVHGDIAFTSPKSWDADTTWLLAKANYRPTTLYSSVKISNALDEVLSWLLRDLISSWYGTITQSQNFVNEVDRGIRAALVNIKQRILVVDIIEVAVSRIVPIITGHLRKFYEAERVIRGKNLNRNVTESEELDLVIAGRYQDGQLHSAASLAYSDTKILQQEYLRKVVARLLQKVLPESMMKSKVVSVLLKEIIACAVFAPLMHMLSDPDTWNRLMEAYGQTMLQDRKTVRKLRAALDQHASPPPKSTKLYSFPKLSPHDDERKFERFIRAIRRCGNLSEARRFRSEVASQLKRESMMEDQDQVYLRRLESGKSLLDQKVGKLSAVGGTSQPRNSQNENRDSHPISRTKDASLLDVLHDSSGLSYFMEYMDRQQLITLVQFWIVVDGLRNPLEDDLQADDSFSSSYPNWTEPDRTDLAHIYEAYLLRPEIKVSQESLDTIRTFLKAGKDATMSQYLQARNIALRAQSAVLEQMQDLYFPNFKKSDLYYKYLTSDDSARLSDRPAMRASKNPTIDTIPESPSKPAPSSRLHSDIVSNGPILRRKTSSSNDLMSSFEVSEVLPHSQPRRSFEINTSAPLFDDEIDDEALTRSTHSIDNSLNGERDDEHQEQMVEAMEAALNDIMTNDQKIDEPAKPLHDYSEPNFLFHKETDSPRSSEDLPRSETGVNGKEARRPNLASLGLVNTSSRIGVFTDNDLFDDEEKFLEDEHADPFEVVDEKLLEEEIHEAAPGDLGLAEAISALTVDIERLVAQESVVDALTRKAELTNNMAELRILRKSKSSLQREIHRKELQRQQYIVQESDNSLYGRANIDIKSIVVGREDDGQQYALYIIEVQRKAADNMSGASWAVARRYSEFHNLHQRLRGIYPAVRHLEFPRRRLVMKLQRDFLHKRRVSLENYLRELLRLPAVCQSRDLRAFLSQQAIISETDTDRLGERRDIISRIYNSVTDGMEEFLGNLPVLDQLSIAGQNLMSAATSQFNTMPQSGTAPEDEETSHTADTRAELLAFENRDMEPFVKPICDLFLEIFELNRSNNWLRGRAVVVVLHQLLGGAVERKVREVAHMLVTEESLLRYINLFRDTMWPGSGPLQRERVTRTDAQKTHSRKEASVMLATLIPDLAGNVVGRANAKAASRRVLATINNQRLNTHLAFTVFDEIVDILFPGEADR